MKQELFTIIFAVVASCTAVFIGYKTKNMGRDKKYNHGHPSCLDNNTHIRVKNIPKCTFCHKGASEKFQPDANASLKEQYYCSEECKKEIIEYIEATNKNGILFLGLIFGTILLMVVASGLIAALNINHRYGLLITYIAMIVMGATVVKFPFCTPQTVHLVGIKKAKFIGRCLGVSIIIAGAAPLIISR